MARALALREPLLVVEQVVGVVGATVDLCDIEKIQHAFCLLLDGECTSRCSVIVWFGNAAKHASILAQNENFSLAKHGNVIPGSYHAFSTSGQHRDKARMSG